MNSTIDNKVNNWRREMSAKLPWTARHAERSAKLALSKAQWLGIDKNQAVQLVFEMALGGFFHAKPHLPFEAWQTVSEQIEGCAGDGELLVAV